MIMKISCPYICSNTNAQFSIHGDSETYIFKGHQPGTELANNRQAVGNQCLNVFSLFIPDHSPLNLQPVGPVASVYGH